MGSKSALAAFLLALTGCEAHHFHYDYEGQLLNPDRSAAANVDLYVTDREDLEYLHGYGPLHGYTEEDNWRAWGTRTAADGRFHGTFNGGQGTYTEWLDLPLAPPAEWIDAVYVVIRRNGEWLPILVPLDYFMQERTGAGARELDLPPVTIPGD